MKKLLLLLVLGVSLSLNEGCKSSQTTVAYKAEGVVITTVDTGMQAWSTYVAAGKATQAQVDLVKSSYNNYYNAQQVAKVALEKAILSQSSTNSASDIATANSAVANAETALLSVLNQYLAKEIK